MDLACVQQEACSLEFGWSDSTLCARASAIRVKGGSSGAIRHVFERFCATSQSRQTFSNFVFCAGIDMGLPCTMRIAMYECSASDNESGTFLNRIDRADRVNIGIRPFQARNHDNHDGPENRRRSDPSPPHRPIPR